MRRSWPFALAVIVVGGLAGVAIAGRPVPSDSFVLDSGSTGTEPSSSTTEVASTTSNSEPIITTTIAATSTVPASTSTTATTTAATTTTEAPTTTTIPGPLPRDQVRLVIANGDGRFQLASNTADRIRPLGYIIDLGNVATPVAETVIYYRPGFDDEAAFAAIDIGVPDALILALPTDATQPITDSDDRGDVIIVLGPDAPR